MKTMLLLSLLSLLLAPKPTIRSVTLTLQTRGVHKEIRVDARQMRVTVNDRVTTLRCPARHWQRLTSLMARMKLADLPTLPARTDGQARDAALAAQIQVVTTDKTYESVSYDHPNPPRAMQPLVQAMMDGLPTALRAEFR